MTKVSQFITNRAIPLMVLFLLLGAWPLWHLPKIAVDNGLDVWLDHQSKEYRDYREFQREYGSDEWALIAFSVHHVPPQQLTSEIEGIAEDLKGIGNGIEVIDITRFGDPRSTVLRHVLISEDEKTAGILVVFPDAGKIGGRKALMKRVEAALSPHRDRYSFHLGGPTVLNAELDRTSEYQSRLFLTAALAVTLGSLFLVFRSAFYVVIAVVASGTAVLWTLGTATASGMTFNMITTVLPVLLWVLSLTGSIHFIHHLRLRYTGQGSLNQTISEALGAVLVPYAIASLTTAIGFLSLLFSHMEPVRDLGLYAAVGIGFGFLSNVVLPPGILKLCAKSRFSRFIPTTSIQRDLHVNPSMIRQWKWLISGLGVAVLFLPVLLVSSVRVESNVLTFFKPESRILKDHQFISHNLSGLSTVELDFRGQQGDILDYAHRLTGKLGDIPDIKVTVYPWGQHIRMSIFVKAMESMSFNKLVNQIKSRMASIASEGIQVRLTGTVVLLNRVQEELIKTQIKSFGIACLIIIALLFVIFRSPSIALFGSIVNLFPIAVLLAIMAIFHIPLNAATIMVASIAIGIAVDDTVFFLVRLRSECVEENCWEIAIDRTLIHLTRPITFTSLVTTIGFFVLLLADFRPIYFFGLLGGVTMISAWIGDLVILPALLYPFRPRFARGRNE
jgi:predicted RND superfamily exporter protein